MFLNPEKLIGNLGIHPGMIIADIGSGIGYFALPAARYTGASGHVYAIDIHDAIIKRLHNDAREQNIENITGIVGDAEVLGGTTLRDETVDMVLIINVLFQSSKHTAIIEESFRILKPGGKMIVIEWSESYTGMGPVEHHLVSPDVIEHMCNEKGFVLIRTAGDVGNHHFGYIFQK